MQDIITKVKGIYDWGFVLFNIGIGLFSIYIDGKNLRNKGDEKEAKISTSLGWVYIGSAIGIYLILIFV